MKKQPRYESYEQDKLINERIVKHRKELEEQKPPNIFGYILPVIMGTYAVIYVLAAIINTLFR